jgi:hypothetical protein
MKHRFLNLFIALLIFQFGVIITELTNVEDLKNHQTALDESLIQINYAISQSDESWQLSNECSKKTRKSSVIEKIDFKNFSYPYKFIYGKKRKINVALRNGECEFDFLAKGGDRSIFTFYNSYNTDVTGDGKKEAIVLLWHTSCGYGSCDGGAGLFYIYTQQKNKLKILWRFETGSQAYGCGLDSFTVKDRKITMELFRTYIDERSRLHEGGKKGFAEDTTRLTFRFNGKKIVEVNKEYITVPERSVWNYEPKISIDE